MPHITSILGNEPGIQYSGVTDKTGSTGSAPINNIYIGKFKRGRLDRPMTITKANIRGMLGYDPKNLDYVAVQDALDTNIPSIQVMRVVIPSCNCQSDFYTLTNSYNLYYPTQYGSVIYTLSLNDQVFQGIISSTSSFSILDGLNSVIAEAHNFYGIVSYSLSSDENGTIYLQNLTNGCLKVNLTASLVLQSNSTNSVNDPVYSTYDLIQNLELCAVEVGT
ncbi:hypothetical protein [Acinetobacter calcoaceticus]